MPSPTWTKRKILRKENPEMENKVEYCFVADKSNRPLAPTKINRGWYLVRKGKAKLKSKYPMVIQFERDVTADGDDGSHIICGIDDGSAHVGVAVVQKCPTKNKVVFKGMVEQRQDVKHLMDVRRGYRCYRRNEKRYRPKRFNNCTSSKRNNRSAPSIKQKKDAVLRVLYQLNKWIDIREYHLEDVAVDIRAMTEGYKQYKKIAARSCKLVWRFNKIYWLDVVISIFVCIWTYIDIFF